jgi:hypothetical protein
VHSDLVEPSALKSDRVAVSVKSRIAIWVSMREGACCHTYDKTVVWQTGESSGVQIVCLIIGNMGLSTRQLVAYTIVTG